MKTRKAGITLAAGVLMLAFTRVVSGRQLAAALSPCTASDLSDRSLHRRSSALRRHLAANPGDRLAETLLNDIDSELISRSGV